MNIRAYVPSDYETVKSWWVEAGELAPEPDMLPTTTYIVFIDKPIAALSLILTNIERFCFAEYLIAAPGLDKALRQEAVKTLVAHVEGIARALGYKGIMGFTDKAALVKRYEALGYKHNMRNVNVLYKGDLWD